MGGTKINVKDMTVGSPYKLILAFSIPLLIGNVFQQLYNMVDSIIVGNYVSETALAAVGTGFPVIFMLSSMFRGIGMGATVMISQFFGAKDLASIKKTVSTLYTAMIIGVIPLSILGIVITKPLLNAMNVPHDGTFEMASTYMVIIFIGTICTLGFNVNAGILQGLGDSKTSLIFLIIAAVINIVLDILFTIFFGWGVFGVALATIIAQLVSWLFGVFYINKHYDFIHIKLFSFNFNKGLFKRAMKIGVPAGIQQTLFSVGIMFMQALVNSYGSSFMAGFNGANKIDTFAFMPIQSFATAVTTYVGQNVGAGKIERVKQGVKSGLILSVSAAILVSALIYPLSGILMRMFSSTPEVIDAGVSYLHQLLPFYFLLAILFMFCGVLRGAGESIVPMISSIVSLWVLRIPTAYLLAHFFGKDTIFYSYPIGWAMGIIIAYGYYRTGKWKQRCITTSSSNSTELSQTENKPSS